MSTEQQCAPVHRVLAGRGYRHYGAGHHTAGVSRDAVLWQRREEGIALQVWEYPARGRLPDCYELEAYEHDDQDARKLLLYSYTADQLADALAAIEQRALAGMRALRTTHPATEEDRAPPPPVPLPLLREGLRAEAPPRDL